MSQSPFAELADRHYSSVLRMCVSILRNAHEAEEVCQEAFLRAYENRDRFDPARSFKTWIFTIAYRLVLNRIRDRGADRRAADRSARRVEPIAVPPGAELREMAERLDGVIRTLSPEDQLLLHYRFREGLSFQEIGEIVGAQENAARVKFFRLLERIRAHFPGDR
jgi:RNA polymerase sigma-70 factor (ECF subfamily)